MILNQVIIVYFQSSTVATRVQYKQCLYSQELDCANKWFDKPTVHRWAEHLIREISLGQNHKQQGL